MQVYRRIVSGDFTQLTILYFNAVFAFAIFTFCIDTKTKQKTKLNKSSVIKGLEKSYEATEDVEPPKATKRKSSKSKITQEQPQQEVNTEYSEKRKILNIIKKHKVTKQAKPKEPILPVNESLNEKIAPSIPLPKEEVKPPAPQKKLENDIQSKAYEINKRILKLSKESVSKVSNYRDKLTHLKLGDQNPKPLSERDMILNQYSEQDPEVKQDKYKILEDAIKRVERQSLKANKTMNPAGGLTGKSTDSVFDDQTAYQHPVISKASNKMEEFLMNDYKINRGEYVSMISNLKNIEKVKYNKQDDVMKVPSDSDILAVNRSKKVKDSFISSDEEQEQDNDQKQLKQSETDSVSERNIEDNVFIEIINRDQGKRVNLKLPDPRNSNKDKLFKLYITNEDHKAMTDKLNSHTDIIIMIDGCSKNNPGKAGSGICFFGRKQQEEEFHPEDNSQILDITDISRYEDNIFDILEQEQK